MLLSRISLNKASQKQQTGLQPTRKIKYSLPALTVHLDFLAKCKLLVYFPAAYEKKQTNRQLSNFMSKKSPLLDIHVTQGARVSGKLYCNDNARLAVDLTCLGTSNVTFL